MKITIETSEPEDERTLKLMFNAKNMAMAFWDISNELWRPARKHGYSDQNISKFFSQDLPEKELNERIELVAALEEKYRGILHDYGVYLED